MAKTTAEKYMGLVNTTQTLWQAQKAFWWASNSHERRCRLKAMKKLRLEALKSIIDLEKEIDILEEMYFNPKKSPAETGR